MSIVLPKGWTYADYGSYVDPILADAAAERTEWIYARTPQNVYGNMSLYLLIGSVGNLPPGWTEAEFITWANALIAEANVAYDSDVLSKIPYELIALTDSYIDAQAPTDLWANAVFTNGGTVTPARKSIIQSFIAAEMASGTWQLTDDYWCLWAENPVQALTSIKQRRLAVAVGSPIFLPNRHYEFDGVASYINTGFIPSSHAVAMTGSDMRAAAYERVNSVSSGNYAVAVVDTSSRNLMLSPRTTGNFLRFALNSAVANGVSATITDSRGWTAASRSAGPVFSGYKNGVFVETIAPVNATTLPTRALYIGANNNIGTAANFRAATIGLIAVGASVTAQQEKDQFDNVQSWAIAVGAAVVGQDDVTLWANAVIGRGGTVSSQRRALMTNFVDALKASNIWDLIDDAWMLVAENPTQALVSLKQRRLAIAVNSPAFTVDRGYAFSGTSYVDTGFTPSANAVAMTGTSMHIAVYERTNLGTNSVAAGCVNSSTQNLQTIPRGTTGLLTAQLNNQAVGPGGDVIADSRGLTVASRNGALAADVLAYRNGVAVVPNQPGTLSSTLPTQKIFIGTACQNTGLPAAIRAATEGFASVGAAIPAGQQLAFYNAVQTFMSGAGAAIAPWSPLDLGASLLAWWDAERLDLITRDGNGRVSSWRDVKNGYNLTQPVLAAQPIYSSTSFGGRPGVTPDGVDDCLELGGTPAWLPAGAAPAEDWYLVDQPTLAADATLYALGAWGSSTNANSRTVYRQVVSSVVRAVGNINAGNINSVVDFVGRHVVRLFTTGAGHTIEVDGLASPETATVPATVATRVRMFASATNTAGSFSKVPINTRLITGPLTAQQAYDLRQWMKGRIS